VVVLGCCLGRRVYWKLLGLFREVLLMVMGCASFGYEKCTSKASFYLDPAMREHLQNAPCGPVVYVKINKAGSVNSLQLFYKRITTVCKEAVIFYFYNSPIGKGFSG